MVEFAVLSAIVKVVVDRVKSRFVNLDGDLINLAAIAAGVALAFAFQIDVSAELVGGSLDSVLAYITSGIGIGLGASFLNDALAAIGSTGNN